MSDPATVMSAMDSDLEALDSAGREIDQAMLALETAAEKYDTAYEDELALLVEEYENRRLPGEDVRRALIHKRSNLRELHQAKRRLERRIDRLEKLARRHEKTLSGRQSELSFLRTEGAAPARQGPANPQTFGARRAA